VSNIAVPTFETRLAAHITVNVRWPNGPHREGAGSVGAAAVVRSALKRISRHGVSQCSRPQSLCPLEFYFWHGPLLLNQSRRRQTAFRKKVPAPLSPVTFEPTLPLGRRL
jgi:hypothetical protein